MKAKLAIVALSMLAVAPAAHAWGIFADNYSMDKSFTDALGSTSMTMAFDGNNYWSSSGGSNAGNREAQYNSSGTLMNTYAAGIDFRSVFTHPAGGTLFARGFSDANIYSQTSPGTFALSFTLTGGTLDAQSSVVFGRNNTEVDAFQGGTLSRWDMSGNSTGSVTFSGFGSQGSENTYPNNRGVAAWGNYWVTFDGGNIYGWDITGTRVGGAALTGAGTGFDSGFSFSYAADGRFWVVDQAGGTWRGYSVAPVPEPATLAVLGLGVVAALRRRKRA